MTEAIPLAGDRVGTGAAAEIAAPEWRAAATWAGTRAPLTASTGLDPRVYTSDEFHGLEQQRVFERAWVCIGLAADVTDPGRLLVRSVGTRSIIVTRGDDGELRAFLNSCRHRGTELAEADCDVAGTIRCPYHRWGYSTDGTLIATPLFEDVPRDRFDRADFGLVPVRVATWGLLLFACLDDETPELLDWLGDLPERMAGYDLERWYRHDEQTVEIEANWKLVTENFQEYYHLRWVHPELAKVSRVQDHYRYQGHGMYCGQTTTPVSGDDRDDWLALPPKPDLDESDGCSGRFVAIFPNVLLSVLPQPRVRDATRAGGPRPHRRDLHGAAPRGVAGGRRRRGCADSQVLVGGERRRHRHRRARSARARGWCGAARSAGPPVRGAAAPVPQHVGRSHRARLPGRVDGTAG